MKAAILKKINYPLSIEEIEPKDLSHGQVLVKILVSGICGSQLHEIKGDKGNEKFLPHLMGHEGCGIVEKIGGGVTTVSVGDKVVMHWRPGDGIEANFPSYTFNGVDMSSGKVTTLSEYSIVSENRLTVVPVAIPNDFVALLGCNLTTAYGIVENEIPVKSNQDVMIVGVGGIGLSIIQAIKQLDRGNVIAVDINESKRALSGLLGADKFLHAQYEKADVIVDTTGNPNVISTLFNFLNPDGVLILVGQPPPGQNILIPNALSLFEGAQGKTIRVTQGGKSNPSVDIPRYIQMFSEGKININSLITHRFTLEKINDAFDLLKTGAAGRIMIDIQGE